VRKIVTGLRGLLAPALFLACLLSSPAFSGDALKLPQIGLVWFGNPSIAGPYDAAFRDGLRELGYVDGKNVTFVTRYANMNASQIPALLDELIALPVDVIVVTPKAVQTARKKSTQIPIVCPDMGNPVRDGLVASLAHPGGNLTGAYAQDSETNAKRLELIKEITPGAKSVGVVFDANDVSLVANAKELRELAQRVKVSLRAFPVHNGDEIQDALGRIERDRLQALIIFDSPLTEAHLEAIMRRAAHRLPVVSEGRDWAKAGALVTYGADYHDMWKHGAIFVDKILKGAKAGDLPVEQPTKFDLVVNMKTAKALGIAIPQSILLRADEVIK
jgi:putative ABC transport system substrate-binding protein